MNSKNNWSVYQIDGSDAKIVYSGPIENFPTDKLPDGRWSIAVPADGSRKQLVLLDKDGIPSKRWKLAPDRFGMLDVTDGDGITVPRTIEWFLKFLELNFIYHPDYGSTSESWLDALDGLWILHLEQKKRIDEQNAQIAEQKNRIGELERFKERSLQYSEQVSASENRLLGEQHRLGSAISETIQALLATKRFGKGGQASKEAMTIRKKLFGACRDVFGKDHPIVKELVKIQSAALGHPVGT